MVAQGRFDPGFVFEMSSRPLAGRTEFELTQSDPQGVEQQSQKGKLRSGALGSGLGLALVKWIADRHRLDIQLDSAPGKGSRFTLRFPREESLK